MRIGVVSDTHNQLRNVARIVELLNRAGVDRVVHTGDITQAKTLEVLAHLDAPLHAVFGNNDLERAPLEHTAARLGIALVDPPLRARWCERELVVVHDPLDLDVELGGRAGLAIDLALHGHTHRTARGWRAGALVFNPGECAGHMAGHNRIGIVDLRAMEAEILHF